MKCGDVSLHSVWIYLLSPNGCAFRLWRALYGQHSSICVHNWMNNRHKRGKKLGTIDKHTHVSNVKCSKMNRSYYVKCSLANQTKANPIKDWLIEAKMKKSSKSVHLRALRTVTSKMKWQGNSRSMQIILSPLRRAPFAWITRVRIVDFRHVLNGFNWKCPFLLDKNCTHVTGVIHFQ